MESIFNNVADLKANTCEFLETTFSKEHLRWLFLQFKIIKSRSSRPEVFHKKIFLDILQNSQESTCVRDSFLINLQAWASKFIKKESLAQVFSCEFCKTSKNTFSYRTPPAAASENVIKDTC